MHSSMLPRLSAKGMWRQLLVALAAAHAFVPRQQPRASLPLRAAADDLASLKKPALVALCRERGLKVSGTKAALLERLAGAEAEAAAPDAAAPEHHVAVE